MPATRTGGSAGSVAGEPAASPGTTVIKYLGSKRRLVPALTVLAEASGARTALDLFCGTTRVAQAWKRLGMEVTAVDSARFAHVLARCYVATDPQALPGLTDRVADAVERLNAVPGRPGYVTATFCEASRYFRPENGARIDAVRDLIEREYAGDDLWPVLMTSLVEAADRVDSTTGLQMAYLKQWAPRAAQPADPAGAGADPRAGPGRPGRCGRAGRLRRARPRGPGLPGPPVQPAPLRLQLPRVGDHRGLGRPGPLRRGLQAGGPPGPRAQERLQRSPHHARGPGPGGGRRSGPRWWCCPTTTSRG